MNLQPICSIVNNTTTNPEVVSELPNREPLANGKAVQSSHGGRLQDTQQNIAPSTPLDKPRGPKGGTSSKKQKLVREVNLKPESSEVTVSELTNPTLFKKT